MSDHTLGIAVGNLRFASSQKAADLNFDTWVRRPRIAQAAGPSRKSIHRSELVEEAQRIWRTGRKPSTESVDHLFVLTMMWGSGKTNGRGPRYTESALLGGNVADALTNARAMLAAGDIAAAYESHACLAGVGPAFFTKVLWVLGRTTEVSPAPLILDSFVWRSLAALGWDSRRAACGSRRWGDRYVAYLHACAAWATNGHTPEDVEYTLFDRARPH